MAVNFKHRSNPVRSFPEREMPQNTFSSIMEQRLHDVRTQAFKGMREMHIPDAVASKVEFVINAHEISPNPSVRKEGDQIILDVPLLFLIKAEDLKQQSEIKRLVFDYFNDHQFNPKDKANVMAFNQFIQDPIQSEKAKKFILYHELAHILHDDFSPVGDEESRIREKRADLASAMFSGAAEGGIYLFNILAPLFDKQECPPTHPLFQERIGYLKEDCIVVDMTSISLINIESL